MQAADLDLTVISRKLISMRKNSAIKQVLWGILFLIGWYAVFCVYRGRFAWILHDLFSEDETFYRLSPWPLVLLHVARWGLILPILILSHKILRWIEACNPEFPDPMLQKDRKKEKWVSFTRSERREMRVAFFMMVAAAVIPGSWVPAGGCAAVALMLLGIGVFAVELLCLNGIIYGLDSIVPVYNARHFRPKDILKVMLILLTVAFVIYMLWMSFHLSYYASAALFKLNSFAEARHRLLLLHALILWGCLPFYLLSVRNRQVFLHLLQLNLWFIPWPKLKVATFAEKFGGEFSGGAGATRQL